MMPQMLQNEYERYQFTAALQKNKAVQHGFKRFSERVNKHTQTASLSQQLPRYTKSSAAKNLT